MLEHLVKGHHGGCFYISDAEPADIEARCAVCGEYDTIEASWDSEVEGAKIDAIADFFSWDSITSKEQLQERMKGFFETDSDYTKLSSIIDYIFEDSSCNDEIIDDLKEDGFLSEEEYTELRKRNKDVLKSQLDFVKELIPECKISEVDTTELNNNISLCLRMGPMENNN